ncbi:PHP domain-containing protein [Aureibacillus halotolerans]|uniref:PHP domain-containing protein n=1 Tax=Aureibacillus halotolerans TaxID=1508390 RepID=A0A4R6U3Q6_9BACI|nr:PHP-associated domain-containing protein [Aureibacillus halotolerans]TDQ41118.1 hypothetical protein EV213_104116 [Aureibacillus halotolerans]
MIIDFHTHVKLSKKVDFDLNYFNEVILNAKEAGLTAIALTEHFNTKHFHTIYETLDQHFPYVHDYYLVNDFKVFTGMEVDVKEVGHILCIGHKDKLLRLRHLLDRHTEEGQFMPFSMLLDAVEAEDLLVIGAHPLRTSTPLQQHPPELLQRLDAFDLNGKDMHEHGIENMQQSVIAFGDSHGVPVVCGSDAHHPIHLGAVKNTFAVECHTANDIKLAITSGAYERYVSPVLHTKVNAAKVVKKKLKEDLKQQGRIVLS